MCLAIFAQNVLPDWPLVVVANRDELHVRPTEAARPWDDTPSLLAGRDLQAGGTWLGLTAEGRIALLTNYRETGLRDEQAPSRGHLAERYLRDGQSAQHYLQTLQQNNAPYNGFNLLLGDLSNVARPEFFWVSNRLLVGDKIRQRKTINPTAISAGLYGLSNAMLDTPWPKVRSGVAQFAQALARDSGKFNQDAMYFNLLADNNNFSDQVLPSTGVSHEWEKALAPIFIQTEHYGTRSSTLLRVRKDGMFQMIERSFQQNELTNTSIFEGQLEQSTTQDR